MSIACLIKPLTFQAFRSSLNISNLLAFERRGLLANTSSAWTSQFRSGASTMSLLSSTHIAVYNVVTAACWCKAIDNFSRDISLFAIDLPLRLKIKDETV